MSAVVRPAQAKDILRLEQIENIADSLLIDFLEAAKWGRAPSGESRVSMSGFVLVAAESSDGEAVGFVQVLKLEGAAHLEQLSVVPDHGRRGIGRALVGAAMSKARSHGYELLTLRTYADVPWNAPFYSTCGFVESEPETQFHRGLVDIESRLGLERYGRRIQMSAHLGQ
jgi:GNAT superfamily N-acetyltransferase